MEGRIPYIFLIVLACSLYFCVLKAAAQAEGNPAGENRIARLVRELGNDSFLRRQQADRELASLGAAAEQQLIEAAKSEQPEVRLRAQRLLERFRLMQMWEPTRCDFQVSELPAGRAIEQLARDSGRTISLAGDQPFSDLPVSLQAQQQPFFQILDEICRQSGNRHRPAHDWNSKNLVVLAGAPQFFPVAYAGPLRMQIQSAHFESKERLDYETGQASAQQAFELCVQLTWEDRFQLSAYQPVPEVVDAAADNGRQLKPVGSPQPTWHVAGKSDRQLSATIELQPPPPGASELKRLLLRWPLAATADVAQLEMTDIAEGNFIRQDDVFLQLKKWRPSAQGKYDAEFLVVRGIGLPDPPESALLEYDFELWDQQGNLFRRQSEGGRITPEGTLLRLSFSAPSKEGAAGRLCLSYPRLRSQKAVEFEFFHVPLPGGRLPGK